MSGRVRTIPTWDWIENNNLIEIDPLIHENMRGIYSIWTEEKCVYVGKALDIMSRLEEHFEKIKWISMNIEVQYKPEYIKVLSESYNKGNKIYVKLEMEVEYKYDNYNRDLHRLAFQEYRKIEEYQEKGWCLNQTPEGSKNDLEEKQWNIIRNKLQKKS